ncbi:MAG: class I SAM-dependent methyltransferase [Elusimicrobia bacterium]|nr:class I SAM-dependent methyltransferase [Candidatus Liberimonas magnetica]
MLSKIEANKLIQFIYDTAIEEKSLGNDHVDNLTSKFSINNYLSMAEEIKSYMPLPKVKILDWGCGYGHMTFLLRKMEFDVISYDVLQDNSQKLIMKKLDVKPIVTNESVKLPFDDCSFDAVLSCGVLEHVEKEKESLKEIRRILRKNGYFFIYRLPNKYSYTEFIATLRKKSCHPIKYTLSSMKEKLKENGFDVVKIGRENILPKNLSFLPAKIKGMFNYYPDMWTLIEKSLLNIPVLLLFCGALNAVAVKKY